MTCLSSTFTNSAYPPPPKMAQTLSPTLNLLEFGPILQTIPAHSSPIISLSPLGEGSDLFFVIYLLYLHQ